MSYTPVAGNAATFGPYPGAAGPSSGSAVAAPTALF